MDSTSTSNYISNITTPPSAANIGGGGGGVESESKKLPSSRFKGVVPQPNGRWGAQIYEKHNRVWLGTFNEEYEAARAYDTAVLRFRGRDAITNLSQPEQDHIETEFLNSRSKAEIVDMLRKHTYDDELQQSRRNYYSGPRMGKNSGPFNLSSSPNQIWEHLFDKIVTPSDVGKLNRLVIPKQHAERHFPLPNGSSSNLKGILLNFEELEGRVWRFRYSYWNSSQSYVLTKGWSRFVKEKNLRAGDIVSFQRSNGQDKQFYIDWKVMSYNNEPGEVSGFPVKPVRLFGVNIFEVPNGKRNMEIDG